MAGQHRNAVDLTTPPTRTGSMMMVVVLLGWTKSAIIDEGTTSTATMTTSTTHFSAMQVNQEKLLQGTKASLTWIQHDDDDEASIYLSKAFSSSLIEEKTSSLPVSLSPSFSLSFPTFSSS